MSVVTMLAGIGVSAVTYSNSHTTIGAFQLDALLGEARNAQYTMSKYPVEAGANVTDFIAPGDKSIQISGCITGMNAGIYEKFLSSPSSILNTSYSSVMGTGEYSPASRLYTAATLIEQIADALQPVTVVTGMDTYSNMCITSLSIERKDLRLSISCTLSPLITAEMQWSQITAASTAPSVSRKASKTKASSGKVATKEPAATAKKTTTSVLNAAFGDAIESRYK